MQNSLSSNTTWNGDWDSGPEDDQGLPVYDPNAPVDKPHQIMELAFFCVADALTVLIILARTIVRRRKIKALRVDDWWIISAGIILTAIYWPTQLAANYYGSGLHWKNMREGNRKKYWIASMGFSGYYIVTSLIKISICHGYLGLLPSHYRAFRLCIKGLCCFIMALGVMETCLWNFDCQPFLSNFIWEIPGVTCIDLDAPRYLWVALSVLIDVTIIWIPFKILSGTKLKPQEKTTLLLVFSANLLGTLACIIGLYGVWMDRWDSALDATYTQTSFIITNNIEILMYTVGASFPVVSPYLVAHVQTKERHQTSFFPSLGRMILNLGPFGSRQESLYPSESHPMESNPNVTDDGRTKESIIIGVKKVAADRVTGWTQAMDTRFCDEENHYQRM